MYTVQELHTKLSELRSLDSENEIVEFKLAGNNYHFDKIGKYVSALSNEANIRGAGEAWLIFGIINDDHSISGSQFRPRESDLMSLKNEIANKTNGRFTFFEIYTISVNERRVVMFHIPPAPNGIPVSFDGHFYAREYDSLVPLSLDKIERIRKQAVKFDWSAQIIPHATVDDLDKVAIDFAKIKYIEKFPDRRDEIQSWSTTKFLNKAKITIKGKITNAAIILLGKEESEHYINPSECKIRWKLLDDKDDSLDYEILHIPMIRAIEKLHSKIRIIKYRYIPEGSLFPEEVDTYDRYSIREALNNCIAHQDYELGGRINVIERPESISFTNKGSFLPGSVEDVVKKDIPEETYRNPFLVSAMYNLKMVDTEGGGIRRMFNIQARRFFPLPEYDLENSRVEVTLVGKVLDMEYARILARSDDLSLKDIILLDKVQKKKILTNVELKYLRKYGFVEGRKTNLYLSKSLAQKTGQKGRYSVSSGFDKQYYKDLILKALKDHGSMSRKEIDEMLLDKLPDSLRDVQRNNMAMNLIQELRKEGKIENTGSRTRPNWVLS